MFNRRDNLLNFRYYGHKVYRTLIRCHFSPECTGGRYIYTGSGCGRVYIYDMFSDELVSVLEPKSEQRDVVRDCRWSPKSMSIISANLNGKFRFEISKGIFICGLIAVIIR